MKVHRFPVVDVLPLSSLIRDYLSDREVLSPFHTGHPNAPLSRESILQRSFSAESRKILADQLMVQYAGLEMTGAVRANIEALRDPNTFTVTTGHQLCIATGPLYVVCKIASTIALARKWSMESGLTIVPVFWLAGEDHDLEEVNHVYAGHEQVRWAGEASGAVGRMTTDGMNEVVEQLRQHWPDSAIREEVLQLLRDAYAAPHWSGAYRKLIHSLFGELGIVCIDADDRVFKAQAVPLFLRDALEQTGQHSVESSSRQLEVLGYETQVFPRPVNLFYLGDGWRKRIDRDGAEWQVLDTEIRFDEKALRAAMEATPERFSPNVVLRPVFQEILLPNIAYVGGPGEVAYWLQLRGMFDRFGVPFPRLILRDSVMVMNERTSQRMEKLGLQVADLFEGRAALERRIVDAAGDLSLDPEKEALREAFRAVIDKARAADATLEGAARAELQKQVTGLEQLEKRMVRAAKAREEQRITQLGRLLEELFPGNGLQERRDNYFDHVVRSGQWMHQAWVNAFDPLEGTLKVFELRD